VGEAGTRAPGPADPRSWHEQEWVPRRLGHQGVSFHTRHSAEWAVDTPSRQTRVRCHPIPRPADRRAKREMAE
jgi:hypothetical protein